MSIRGQNKHADQWKRSLTKQISGGLDIEKMAKASVEVRENMMRLCSKGFQTQTSRRLDVEALKSCGYGQKRWYSTRYTETHSLSILAAILAGWTMSIIMIIGFLLKREAVWERQTDRQRDRQRQREIAVSYTHLTLPTSVAV